MDAFEQLHAEYQQLQQQVAGAVVGHEQQLELLLIALLAGEHCLFESPPGTGRVLLVEALARVCRLRWSRLHCHQRMEPEDLLAPASAPADQAGLLQPLNAHLLAIDDVDRLNPRMQALLHQLLQEGQAAVQRHLYQLPEPHLVLTLSYRQDELQERAADPRDDRYLFKLAVGYPDYEQEYQMAARRCGPPAPAPEPVWDETRILALRDWVRQGDVPEEVVQYALRLVRATRVHEEVTPDFVYEWVQSGAGARASQFLTLAAKIRAALLGRPSATVDDVRALAHPVLRHRIRTNQNARENGIKVDKVIDRLLDEVSQAE